MLYSNILFKEDLVVNAAPNINSLIYLTPKKPCQTNHNANFVALQIYIIRIVNENMFFLSHLISLPTEIKQPG